MAWASVRAPVPPSSDAVLAMPALASAALPTVSVHTSAEHLESELEHLYLVASQLHAAALASAANKAQLAAPIEADVDDTFGTSGLSAATLGAIQAAIAAYTLVVDSRLFVLTGGAFSAAEY